MGERGSACGQARGWARGTPSRAVVTAEVTVCWALSWLSLWVAFGPQQRAIQDVLTEPRDVRRMGQPRNAAPVPSANSVRQRALGETPALAFQVVCFLGTGASIPGGAELTAWPCALAE